MKLQALFSMKDKSEKLKLSSASILLGSLRINSVLPNALLTGFQ